MLALTSAGENEPVPLPLSPFRPKHRSPKPQSSPHPATQ
jgi:hypothetical protein